MAVAAEREKITSACDVWRCWQGREQRQRRPTSPQSAEPIAPEDDGAVGALVGKEVQAVAVGEAAVRANRREFHDASE